MLGVDGSKGEPPRTGAEPLEVQFPVGRSRKFRNDLVIMTVY